MKEKKLTKEGTEKLGMNQKIGIMLCAMVSAVATGYVPNYINIYYTDNVGISMGAVDPDDYKNNGWCNGYYHGNDH